MPTAVSNIKQLIHDDAYLTPAEALGVYAQARREPSLAEYLDGVPNRGFIACASLADDLLMVIAWMDCIAQVNDKPEYTKALCGMLRQHQADHAVASSMFIILLELFLKRTPYFSARSVFEPDSGNRFSRDALTWLHYRVDFDACAFEAASTGNRTVLLVLFDQFHCTGPYGKEINFGVTLAYSTGATDACGMIDWMVLDVHPNIQHSMSINSVALRRDIETCMWSAAKRNRFDVICHMMDYYGAEDTDEAFVGAAVGGHVELLKKLERFRPSIAACESAMYEAVNAGHMRVCEYLVRTGRFTNRKECMSLAKMARSYKYMELSGYLEASVENM